MKKLILAATIAVAIAGAPEVRAQQGCLEAVGGLSAGHTYTSFLLIGTTADGFAKKAFDADHVSEIMTEVGNLCGSVTGLLGKLKAGKLSASDARYVGDIEAVYALLKDQSLALAAVARSGKPADSERYEKARTAVYPKIRALLGIDEKGAPVTPAISPAR